MLANTLTGVGDDTAESPVLLNWVSSIWIQARAALVHMATEVNDIGDCLP